MLTHYDRVLVGTLCEKAGLYQRVSWIHGCPALAFIATHSSIFMYHN
jgi:hypothetical protein